MIQPGTVIEIDGSYYRARYRDSGFVHAEDCGLWRCDLVTRNGDQWEHHDDDDWMISDDPRIVAREVGWNLWRFVPTDWGFDHYMKW